MTIQAAEILPLLDRLLQQQGQISQKLGLLTEALQRAPEPVEPVLRELLEPIKLATDELRDALGG